VSAEDLVNSIIAAAQVTADKATGKAIGYADDAITASTSVTDLNPIPTVTKPTAIVPEKPPAADEAEDKFRTTFSELFNQLGPEFDSRLNAFLARFFPVIDVCLQTSVDQWICNTITNGATGIPVTVENQIWERSRARELKDAARRDDELVAQWAGRGFSIPPGALYDAQQKAQQDLSEKISTHSRDVAIKQVEIQIETIKFAVGKGIELRLGALEAAGRYIQSWLEVGKIAVEYANGILRSRSYLYQALAAYYDALIRSERLIYDWGNDTRTLTIRQQEAFVALVTSNTKARVEAAISAANSVGGVARAALAAQNTLAHIGSETEIAG
jgi:hypothetical protein